MTICLYMRMSTNMQEHSIESQRKVLTAYAQSHGMAILTEYVDEGISGRKAEKRPGFLQMIEDSGAGTFEAVLIYDSSRFARNLEESIVYKSMLKRNGVALISATEPNTDDEEVSLLTDAMLGAMNEMYSRKLSKAVKRGMTHRIEQGFVQNKPPFGYYKDRDNPVIQIHPEQAEIVKYIFERYTTDMPAYLAIAKHLNQRGVYTRTGVPWLIKDIRRILKNVTYAGYISANSVNDFTYKGRHTPIVSEELFHRVQDISRGKKRAGSRDGTAYAHWLSSILVCGACGQKMGFNPMSAGRNPVYRCIGNARGLCYPTIAVGVPAAEKAVLGIFGEIIRGKYDIEVDRIIRRTDIAGETNVLTDRINKIENRLKRHKTAFAEGIDTIEEYRANKTAALLELDETQKALTDIQKAPSTDQTIKKVRKELESLSDYLASDSYTTMQKSSAIKRVIHHIVYNKKQNEFTIFFIC